jgi:hypothetical protein
LYFYFAWVVLRGWVGGHLYRNNKSTRMQGSMHGNPAHFRIVPLAAGQKKTFPQEGLMQSTKISREVPAEVGSSVRRAHCARIS